MKIISASIRHQVNLPWFIVYAASVTLLLYGMSNMDLAIRQQRDTIRAMTSNPACMMGVVALKPTVVTPAKPEAKKRRVRVVTPNPAAKEHIKMNQTFDELDDVTDAMEIVEEDEFDPEYIPYCKDKNYDKD